MCVCLCVSVCSVCVCVCVLKCFQYFNILNLKHTKCAF